MFKKTEKELFVYKYNIKMSKTTINIALIGCVSAGKSTLSNALFCEQFSDCHIKRTTALPQVYHAIGKVPSDDYLQKIRIQNRETNDRVMQIGNKLEYKDIKEIDYYVPPMFDMLKLNKGTYATIYDLPGVNDSQNKKVYYEYADKNFHKFDIVVFVVDIHSALNTLDEIDILDMILKNIRINFDTYKIITRLIVLINKCDEMKLTKNKLQLIEPELQEMEKQIMDIIEKKKTELFSKELMECISITKVSCEDAFIYRMYSKNPGVKLDDKYLNKFGANECGKNKWARMSDEKKQENIKIIFKKFKDEYKECIQLCGFYDLQLTFKTILSVQQQYEYLTNHLKYDVSQITDYKKYDIAKELDMFKEIKDNLDNINKMYVGVSYSNKWFDDSIQTFMDNYKKHNEQYLKTDITLDEKNYGILNTIKVTFVCFYDKFATYWFNESKNYEIVMQNTQKYNLTEIKKYDIPYESFIKHIEILESEEHHMTFMGDVLSNLANYKWSTQQLIVDTLVKYIKYVKQTYREVIFNNVKIMFEQYNGMMLADLNKTEQNTATIDEKKNTCDKYFLEIYELDQILKVKSNHVYIAYLRGYAKKASQVLHQRPYVKNTNAILDNILTYKYEGRHILVEFLLKNL